MSLYLRIRIFPWDRILSSLKQTLKGLDLGSKSGILERWVGISIWILQYLLGFSLPMQKYRKMYCCGNGVTIQGLASVLWIALGSHIYRPMSA